MENIFLTPSRLQELLDHLEQYAQANSCCKRRQVAALVAYENRIIAWGVNRRNDNTKCETCLRQERKIASGEHSELCYALHAEMDALIKASRCEIDLSKCMLICTTQPCSHCLKSIMAYGITKVYYHYPYHDTLNETLAEGIECIQF